MSDASKPIDISERLRALGFIPASQLIEAKWATHELLGPTDGPGRGPLTDKQVRRLEFLLYFERTRKVMP